MIARRGRRRALRRAWRSFWWMVVFSKDDQLPRRTWLGIAFREARCGLLTGVEHSWGPLEHAYEGARLRRQKCRWCGASLTPASEFEANPPTEEERLRWEGMIRKPTDDDVARALKLAEERGIYRDGKFPWD